MQVNAMDCIIKDVLGKLFVTEVIPIRKALHEGKVWNKVITEEVEAGNAKKCWVTNHRYGTDILVAWQITDFHARRSKGAWRPHLQ
jgi:hypothetical protein